MTDFVLELLKSMSIGVFLNFFEPILERWYSAHASQQNVVIMKFGSPCPPRSPQVSRDTNDNDQ